MRFPLARLARPLTTDQRANIRRYVRGLLGWNETLEQWPRRVPVVDAAPFVALYAGGKLKGCVGASDGPPSERLARAFVLASADLRFGGTTGDERASMAAQVVFLQHVRRIEADDVERELEVGTDGIALVDARDQAIVLLPSVARDGRLDTEGFLRAMADKSGLPRGEWARAGVFLFRTEEVAVRRENLRSPAKGSPLDLAAAHLATLVARSGAITFSIDPRTGAASSAGEMHHGRVAVAVRALEEHGGHAAAVARAKTRLARDVRAALRGKRVAAWPERPDVVAGTLALVAACGVDVQRDLQAWAEAHPEIASNPWHAGQVVAALARSAPPPLWEACVRDLDVRAWAPWTAIAAHARGDASVLARCASTIEQSIRPAPPHAGGCERTTAPSRTVPETALTALAVEALSPLGAARVARRRACDFLRRQQITGDPPASLLPDVSVGAFRGSPVLELLRADITGHALLALRRES
jgi:AMMECR1 domain-containing protein